MAWARMCCGLLMVYQDVFGIRVWHCSYRHHSVIYENLRSGETITDDNLEVREQSAGEP